MAKLTQQLMYLCINNPHLNSDVVAWSLYDSSLPKDTPQMQTGDSDKPPYPSVLDAMRDGWRVIQVPAPPYFSYGHENEAGHIENEFVLERMVEVHD